MHSFTSVSSAPLCPKEIFLSNIIILVADLQAFCISSAGKGRNNLTLIKPTFSPSLRNSSTTILDVPVDLLVWSAALGLALGPLYEFIRRLEVK